MQMMLRVGDRAEAVQQQSNQEQTPEEGARKQTGKRWHLHKFMDARLALLLLQLMEVTQYI